jgi:Holliday junction resolvase
LALNSRNKGASGERELAGILRGYGFDTRRGQQYCGINGDADVVGINGLHIECKRVERLNIDDAMEQSRRDAKEGEIPIVCHRKNRKKWLVTIDLEEFFKLWEAKDEEGNTV